MSEIRIWIGLLGVVPKHARTALGDSHGAYVTVVALVKEYDQFQDCARIALEEYDFEVCEYENVEPLEHRTRKFAVDENILILASQLRVEGDIQFGSFHSFPETRS